MLDALDESILAVLRRDARTSHRAIATQVGSTQPTVTARIKRMEDAGLILGYSVQLDEGAFAQPSGNAQVVCHWCKRRTPDPVWAKLAKQHPFCCTTCRSAYLERHAKLSKDL